MPRAPEPTFDPNEPSRLAAVLFDRDDDVDAVLRDFVASARRDGARVAGLLQERVEAFDCDCEDVRLRDIGSGAELAIMQDLGAGATGCRVDTAAIAVAAGWVGLAIAEAPDLLIFNRFGKLECEGGGLLAELGEAVARGLPVVVSVPLRFREAWNGFAEGLDAQLPPQTAALEDWWAGVVATAARVTEAVG